MPHRISAECEGRMSKLEQVIFDEKHGLMDKCAAVDEEIDGLERKYNFALGGISMFNAILAFGLVVWQILKK